MGTDFRGIRVRLHWQLLMLRGRVIDAQIKFLSRIIGLLGDTAPAADLKAQLNELAPKLDEQNKWALYTSVGQALSAWAVMEESLVGIAALLLRTDLPKAGIMMYSIINFQVWLNVISELFSQDEIYVTLKPKWNKIFESLRPIKDTRDRLAHHTVWHEDKVDPMISSHSLLKPADYDTRQKSQKQKYKPLDYDQIYNFIESVHKVQDECKALINSMAEKARSIAEKARESQPSSQKPSEQDHDPHPH
jgi:hypothetical protein